MSALVSCPSAVLDLQSPALPAELGRDSLAAADRDVLTFAQTLHAVYLAAADAAVFRVPERRAAGVAHLRAEQSEIVRMPERIAQSELTISDVDVFRLLHRRLAVSRSVENAVLHNGSGKRVERTLLVKGLILYYCHFVFLSSDVFYTLYNFYRAISIQEL